MIKDIISKYETDLSAMLSKLGIAVKVSERENCYYLTVDGTALFPTTEIWKAKVGRSFEEFVKVFIPSPLNTMENHPITETKIEFRIGNVFDMISRSNAQTKT